MDALNLAILYYTKLAHLTLQSSIDMRNQPQILKGLACTKLSDKTKTAKINKFSIQVNLATLK